jgi:hypothetical protein
MISENAVSDFIGILEKLAPGVETSVDTPSDPNGETFIDIRLGAFSTEVSYRPAFGFGIFIKEGIFGQRPDELFRHADKAATRIMQLRNTFEKDGSIKQLTLADMQVLLGVTDVRKAETFLNVQQVLMLLHEIGKSVQQTEKTEELFQEIEKNLRVETFASRIQAMGGRLEMSVVFDDMEARLELPLD